jgi:hypothetical protein
VNIKSKFKIPEILQKEHPFRRDGKLVIFLICIGISFFFWTLLTLSKTYTTQIVFPVKYTNLPKDKIISSSPPESFKLSVNAYGFTLFRHKLKMSFSPILINVNEITNHIPEKNNLSRYSVSTNDNRNIIEDQVSSEIRILNIYPDSIKFLFDDIIEEKIVVKPVADITLAKQYILQKELYTTPDSVTVKGPRSIVDTLKFVSTKRKRFRDLTNSVNRNTLLKEIPGIEIAQKRVALNIPVEQSTEANCEIPIILKNVPDSFSVKIFPGKIKVSYMVGLSQYENIGTASFRAVIDFNNRNKVNDKLPITIEKYPNQIFSLDFTPKRVEYILEKNPARK